MEISSYNEIKLSDDQLQINCKLSIFSGDSTHAYLYTVRPIKQGEYLYWDYFKEDPTHFASKETKEYIYEQKAPKPLMDEIKHKIAAAKSRSEFIKHIDTWTPPVLPPREGMGDDYAIPELDELHLDHIPVVLEQALTLPKHYSQEVERLAEQLAGFLQNRKLEKALDTARYIGRLIKSASGLNEDARSAIELA